MQSFIRSVAFLASLRIVRGWNQTGQKHAGGADIAKTVLPTYNVVLWSLVGLTYFDVLQRLARITESWASRRLSLAMTFALGMVALRFKIDFTKADAPELLYRLDFLLWPYLEETSLVAQARTVFASIVTLTALSFLPKLRQDWAQNTDLQGSCPAPISSCKANSIISKMPRLPSMTY